MRSLDDPERAQEIQEILKRKFCLRRLYTETYRKFAECLRRSPSEGLALELGSGAGFLNQIMPEVLTSDVLPYPSVQQVLDASHLPFRNGSIRAIFMLNVFHHISNVEAFLAEAQRCLVVGGRVFIVDPHPGWISAPIYMYIHHEPYDPKAKDWIFPSTGPLTSANAALAWIVFQRDRQKLMDCFPKLKLELYRPHTPLRYWLCGGLRKWCILPPWSFTMATHLDSFLSGISPNFGSFVDIELVKTV